MALQINGTTVVDNSRNITGVSVTGTDDLSFGSGTTPARPASPVSGDIRYNTTLAKIEVYNGSQWRLLTEIPAVTGIFGGGVTPSINSSIQYLDIASTGNTTKFGELATGRYELASCASSTRGVFAGGRGPTATGIRAIDYITISSTGNAINFGNLLQPRYGLAGCSNSTRGVFGGGGAPTAVRTIDYITIATTGNALSFNNLGPGAGGEGMGACASQTEGVFASPSGYLNYIEFATTGSEAYFGNLTVTRDYTAGASSPTRGIFAGGIASLGARVTNIDYITFDTKSVSTYFGDLSVKRGKLGGASNSVRGVFAGGQTSATVNSNIIDYITIASSGNATDFGDLITATSNLTGTSDGHGGLG